MLKTVCACLWTKELYLKQFVLVLVCARCLHDIHLAINDSFRIAVHFMRKWDTIRFFAVRRYYSVHCVLLYGISHTFHFPLSLVVYV